MSARKVTAELSEALSQLVDAHLGMRKAAVNSDRFEQASARFEKAAEKTAREAMLAGFRGDA